MVKAPSSEFRLRYPSSRATMASMRTRPKPWPSPLGGPEPAVGLGQLLPGGEIGEGDIKLGPLHVHVHPDEPLVLRQCGTGIHGIIEKIAQDAAQVDFGCPQLHGNVHPPAPGCPCS